MRLLGVMALLTSVIFSDAQNPTIYNGTPPTFMTFTAPYVKCRYGSYWCSVEPNNNYWTTTSNSPNNWTTGTYGSASYANSATNGIMPANPTNWSHRLITSHTTLDPCMCYQTGTNTYTRMPVLPVGGWDLEESTLYDPIDTVIQLGGPNDQGTGSQTIEYWFRPSTEESVLMVMLAFATEASNHPTYQNAKFYVEVLDSAYNLLDLGYYPDLNGTPMSTTPYYWPYSRFLYVPINTSNTTCNIPYCLATPVGYDYYGTNDENKAFQISECPYAQFNGQVPESHSNVNSQWFRYTQIAFDLGKYAKKHATVVFRVKSEACVMNYHWSYGYFAAKLIRGYIAADVCNHNELWLSVPDGFSENSYVWYAGADSASAQRTQIYDGLHNIFISRTTGHVYPYYRCEVKTQAGVPIIYECKVPYLSNLSPAFQYEQTTCDSIYTLKFYNYSNYKEIRPSVNPGAADTIAYPVQYVEWDFGDGSPVETTLSPTHIYPALGSYPVKLKIYDKYFRCCDSVMNNVLVDSKNHFSIQQHTADEVRVFPNPTSDNVTIQSMTSSIQEIQLFDLTGKLIHARPVNSETITLDMQSYPAGIYSVRVKTDNGLTTKRIMKR